MLNRCEFIGNLGADPEVRTTQSGGKIVSFRLACTEKWKDQSGERKEKTEWVSVVIFAEGLARIAETHLRKGSRCYVAGQFCTRKWQDQSGADRYSTEIVLRPYRGELTMLDGGGERREEPQREPQGGRRGFSDDLGDEIPFAPEWR